MAREEVELKVSGLWTYEDVFSSVPSGSLSVANNIVIDQKNLASPRRGYARLPSAITAMGGDLSFGDAQAMFSFLGYPHYHKSNGTLYYYNNNEWFPYPTGFVKPTGTNRSRHAAANKNIYITSQNGVQKIAAAGAPIVDAGARPGYAPDVRLSLGAGSLITMPNQGYAYRIVWGYKDVNNNLVLGAPSSRTVLLNYAVVNKDPELFFQIPDNVTTDWFYQIYRTLTTPATTIGQVGDRLYLAYEGNPTPTDIDARKIGSVSPFVDTQPDELLGSELYTNAEVEGVLQSNFEPPQCKDIALYQGHLFFANTTQKSAITVQLLGTGTDGLRSGDTITIGGVWFKAIGPAMAQEPPLTNPNNVGKTGASDATAYEFQLYWSTSPSADVERTAKALVSILNTKHTTIDGYYYSDVSGDSTQLPGQIRLVEKDYNLAPGFAVKATTFISTERVWTPDLRGVGQVAVGEQNPNRIYYSKLQRPEAVPINNYFDVGPANIEILRILPLRTALLIFTQREIYKIYGSTQAAFQPVLLDNTAKLIASDTAVVLNNSVIGLFDQGVCQVSEGVAVLSRGIEGDLLNLRGVTGTNLESLGFAVGYESDRKYILYVPITAGDTTQAKAAYVYNTVTSTWTFWDKTFKHGMLHPEDDKLYMLNSLGVSQERKNYNERDIADEQVPVPTLRVFKGTFATTLDLQAAFPDGAIGDEITRRSGFYSFVVSTSTVWNWSTGLNAWVDSGVSETVPALANVIYVSVGTLTSLAVGDVYYESVSKYSKITQIDPVNIRFYTQDNLDWSGGTWEAQKIIPCEIRWNPIFMGNPSMLKQFSEVTVLTTSSLESLLVGFKGVSSSDYEDIQFAGTATGAWGLFPWGDVPWGGDPEVLRYRTLVPMQKQRDSAIFIRAAQDTIYNNFEISGLSIIYRVIGPRVVR